MIDRAEILAVANELSLSADVVEKDYVLGWLLAGIYNNEELTSAWVFKGGTCLKKCYFETYRFSEDLDFTVTVEAQLDAEFLTSRFRSVAAWVYEETGITIPAERLRFEVFRNARGGLSCEGRIYYSGPLQRTGSISRIKLDLTADELLVMAPQERPVGHTYSDLPEVGIHARCYAYEELFAEKVRALGERTRPRDLYDVINLFRHGEFRPAVTAVLDVLKEKCAFKGIAVPTFGSLGHALEELTADWPAMLGHQLPVLPPFESFWNELPHFFAWLETGTAVTVSPMPMAAGDAILRPAIGVLRRQGVAGSSSLERIRFAGTNRLCVELDYVDEQGRRSTRLIEPYSLRRTLAGDIILSAVRVDNDQTRSYRLDRMRGANVTERPFVPRFEIELSATERGAILPTARGSVRGFASAGPRTPARATSRPGRTRTGPVYIYRCPVCQKTFRRTRHDARLSPHKSPQGWACSGRTGYFVETR